MYLLLQALFYLFLSVTSNCLLSCSLVLVFMAYFTMQWSGTVWRPLTPWYCINLSITVNCTWLHFPSSFRFMSSMSRNFSLVVSSLYLEAWGYLQDLCIRFFKFDQELVLTYNLEDQGLLPFYSTFWMELHISFTVLLVSTAGKCQYFTEKKIKASMNLDFLWHNLLQEKKADW